MVTSAPGNTSLNNQRDPYATGVLSSLLGQANPGASVSAPSNSGGGIAGWGGTAGSGGSGASGGTSGGGPGGFNSGTTTGFFQEGGAIDTSDDTSGAPQPEATPATDTPPSADDAVRGMLGYQPLASSGDQADDSTTSGGKKGAADSGIGGALEDFTKKLPIPQPGTPAPPAPPPQAKPGFDWTGGLGQNIRDIGAYVWRGLQPSAEEKKRILGQAQGGPVGGYAGGGAIDTGMGPKRRGPRSFNPRQRMAVHAQIQKALDFGRQKHGLHGLMGGGSPPPAIPGAPPPGVMSVPPSAGAPPGGSPVPPGGPPGAPPPGGPPPGGPPAASAPPDPSQQFRRGGAVRAFQEGGDNDDEPTGAIPDAPPQAPPPAEVAGSTSQDPIFSAQRGLDVDALAARAQDAMNAGMAGAAPSDQQQQQQPPWEQAIRGAVGDALSPGQFPGNAKRIYDYLTGADAAHPEQVKAVQNRIDPHDEMTPNDRATATVAATTAENPSTGWSMLQHFRNAFEHGKQFAAHAFDQGDTHAGVNAANVAFGNVPNTKHYQFVVAGRDPSAGINMTVTDQNGNQATTHFSQPQMAGLLKDRSTAFDIMADTNPVGRMGLLPAGSNAAGAPTQEAQLPGGQPGAQPGETTGAAAPQPGSQTGPATVPASAPGETPPTPAADKPWLGGREDLTGKDPKDLNYDQQDVRNNQLEAKDVDMPYQTVAAAHRLYPFPEQENQRQNYIESQRAAQFNQRIAELKARNPLGVAQINKEGRVESAQIRADAIANSWAIKETALDRRQAIAQAQKARLAEMGQFGRTVNAMIAAQGAPAADQYIRKITNNQHTLADYIGPNMNSEQVQALQYAAPPPAQGGYQVPQIQVPQPQFQQPQQPPQRQQQPPPQTSRGQGQQQQTWPVAGGRSVYQSPTGMRYTDTNQPYLGPGT